MVLIARVLLFVLIVAIAAVVGAFAAFFGLYFIGRLMGTSDFEGALAMGAAGFMPAGAVIGAIVGAIVAWRLIRKLERRAVMGAGYGLAGAVALGAAGWFGLDYYQQGGPYAVEEEPTVLIEWRLPEQVSASDIVAYRFTMRSTFKDWTLNTSWDEPPAREEEGQTVLRFRGSIRWRREGRIFQLWKFPQHDDRITVELKLGADPEAQADYGPWREAGEGHAFRTRVVR
jgi:MFS family permease